MHFNTTKENARTLAETEAKTDTQEQAVMDIYRQSKKGLTASEVFRKYPKKNTPLTSIRRAISVLKDDKFLVKTIKKRPGIYGRNEFVFNIYTGQLNLFT